MSGEPSPVCPSDLAPPQLVRSSGLLESVSAKLGTSHPPTTALTGLSVQPGRPSKRKGAAVWKTPTSSLTSTKSSLTTVSELEEKKQSGKVPLEGCLTQCSPAVASSSGVVLDDVSEAGGSDVDASLVYGKLVALRDAVGLQADAIDELLDLIAPPDGTSQQCEESDVESAGDQMDA